MSLNFDLRDVADLDEIKIKDHNTECWTLPGWVDSAIFSTMAIDIGNIENEAVAEEAFLRLSVWCAVHGTTYPTTLEDYKRLIGLKVNVITLSRNQWWQRLSKHNGSTKDPLRYLDDTVECFECGDTVPRKQCRRDGDEYICEMCVEYADA